MKRHEVFIDNKDKIIYLDEDTMRVLLDNDTSCDYRVREITKGNRQQLKSRASKDEAFVERLKEDAVTNLQECFSWIKGT